MLTGQGYNHDEAEDMLFDAILNHNNLLDLTATIPSLVEKVEWKSMNVAKRAINLIVEFDNDTPLWINKGHTPEELYHKPPPFTGKPTFAGALVGEMNMARDQRIGASKQDAPGVVMPFQQIGTPSKMPNFPIASPKVGRNDPCPCGSGRKYKQCCGRHA